MHSAKDIEGSESPVHSHDGRHGEKMAAKLKSDQYGRKEEDTSTKEVCGGRRIGALSRGCVCISRGAFVLLSLRAAFIAKAID